jgi:hypothetical protein
MKREKEINRKRECSLCEMRTSEHEKMEGNLQRSEGKLFPNPQLRAPRHSTKMETHAELGSDGRDPAPTNPPGMEEPRADSAAAFPSLACPDALPAPNQVRSPRRPSGTYVPLDGFVATSFLENLRGFIL